MELRASGPSGDPLVGLAGGHELLAQWIALARGTGATRCADRLARDAGPLIDLVAPHLHGAVADSTRDADLAVTPFPAGAACAMRRTHRLAFDLLAFSRRLPPRPRPVDAGALFLALADLLGRTLDPRIAVSLRVSPDCPACLVDRDHLECALFELVGNERDAMAEGGRLHLDLRAVDELPQLPRRPEARDADADADAGGGGGPAGDGYVAFSVRDSGPGMTDAVRRHAPEPFFTTKETGRHHGLGLSAVAALMAASHGALQLASAPGRGTTATLFVPRGRAGA